MAGSWRIVRGKLAVFIEVFLYYFVNVVCYAFLLPRYWEITRPPRVSTMPSADIGVICSSRTMMEVTTVMTGTM